MYAVKRVYARRTHGVAATGDRSAAEIEEIVREIVTALDGVPPATCRDHAERALLRSYLAEDDVVPDPDDEAGRALGRAITTFAATTAGLGLFGGAAGIGWTVTHLAGGEAARLACERFDTRSGPTRSTAAGSCA